LFHGVGSLQSTPREAGDEHQQQHQHVTPVKQQPLAAAYVDLTRPLKNEKQLKVEEIRRQSSQKQTPATFENSEAKTEVARSSRTLETRDAQTSTSAVLHYASSLERFV
jgi:ABC-type phosphate transport system substrate-binding protein